MGMFKHCLDIRQMIFSLSTRLRWMLARSSSEIPAISEFPTANLSRIMRTFMGTKLISFRLAAAMAPWSFTPGLSGAGCHLGDLLRGSCFFVEEISCKMEISWATMQNLESCVGSASTSLKDLLEAEPPFCPVSLSVGEVVSHLA